MFLLWTITTRMISKNEVMVSRATAKVARAVRYTVLRKKVSRAYSLHTRPIRVLAHFLNMLPCAEISTKTTHYSTYAQCRVIEWTSERVLSI